jgi:hypothetical protein
MEVNGQLHAPAALPQGKEPRYPLDRRLGGPQSRSGRNGEEKNSHPRRESNTRTPIAQPIKDVTMSLSSCRQKANLGWEKEVRKIFGRRTEAVTGEWRKSQNEKFHNLYSSAHIIRVIKSKTMILAGSVAHIGMKIHAKYA